MSDDFGYTEWKNKKAERPMIIGLHGLPRTGKDTIAKFLLAEGWAHRAFATPLKHAATHMLGLSFAQLNGDDPTFDREALLPGREYSARQFLQKLGTEVGRHIDPDIWVRAMARSINRYDTKVVITDLRFPNEADWVHSRGGLLVHVTRKGIDSHNDHISNQALACDFTLANDGDLAELRHKVLSFLKDHV